MSEEMTAEEFISDCELTQAAALAEKAQQEAAYIKWQARREELAYQQELAEHQWQYDGIYSFHKRVTQRSADKLLHTLHRWHQHDRHKPWTIYLNSVGGEEFSGWAVIDELRSHSIMGNGTHHITVKVRGRASSMGGMILQAADDRLMGPGSWLMIHKGSSGAYGTVDEINDSAKWVERTVDQMVDLFVERSGLSRREIRSKISRRDWWMTADEAVELGFADGIG